MSYKGLVLLFLLVTSLFLSGCENTDAKRPDLNSDYTFEALINSNNKTFSVNCIKESEQWTFTYTSPAELKDMVVVINNQDYKISYNGLIQEGNREDMPYSNICNIVARTIDCIKSGKSIKFTKKDDIITGKGVFDGGDLKVTYTKNKLPDEIVIGKEIKIKFIDFKKT